MTQPINWYRFSRYIYDDYWPMSINYWEGIVFIPKRDVWWFGFGVFAEKNGRDMPLDVQWHIDDEISEQYHFTMMDADKDPVNKWHSIDIREKFDHPPIRVSEGQRIAIKIRPTDDDRRRTWIGTHGGHNYYSTKEGQDYDFDVK